MRRVFGYSGDEVNSVKAALDRGAHESVLARHLPEGAIVTVDAGTSTNFTARHLPMCRGMMFLRSGGLPTTGSAVPYAIALTGDGTMQMNGLNDLVTV